MIRLPRYYPDYSDKALDEIISIAKKTYRSKKIDKEWAEEALFNFAELINCMNEIEEDIINETMVRLIRVLRVRVKNLVQFNKS